MSFTWESMDEGSTDSCESDFCHWSAVWVYSIFYYLLLFPFPLLSRLSIFLLFQPFPFYQNSPYRFQARFCRRRQNLALVFYVLILLYVFFSYGYMLVFVVFDLPLSCGLGGCWTERRPWLRWICRWPSFTWSPPLTFYLWCSHICAEKGR